MFDFNMLVPDFTSKKYTDENKFLLLKNYLYELNDMLAFTFNERTQNVQQNNSVANDGENIE